MINCPKCSSEVLVQTPALGNIPLDVCPVCSGIWFDKDELEALLKQSQGWALADFTLLNPKAESLVCPRCKSRMSRGGLVNPLLLVDRCQSCGGVWLDPHELELVKKLLGLTGGETEATVPRPARVAPPVLYVKYAPIKLVPAAVALLGAIGISFEMYLYFSPADAVSHQPYAGVLVASILLFAGGIFFLNRGKQGR